MKDISKNFVRHITIDEAVAGQRVDNFLRKYLKGVPSSHIYRIVRGGEVRINGARIQPSTHLMLGDIVRIPPLRLPARLDNDTGKPSAMKLSVLRKAAALPVVFEDAHLLAIDKPAGLAAHGGSGISFGVIEQLRAQRPDLRFLELAHRLDRETSGVLLLAKKRSALTALHTIWREGDIEKHYDVLVRGAWRDAKRRVSVPLTRYLNAQGERRVRVDDDDGQSALTVFYRRQVWKRLSPSLSLLDAELRTGRTHQIRVHLTHLGFPLAGDTKYGDFAWNRELAAQGLNRMFLHARELSFEHPHSGEMLTITAELPITLSSFVAHLDECEEKEKR
ncbi:MAG: RluA family pseudouridine synthase [Burkholderiales bacterium]|jgi:23S rRNA pseudouridine955/2504/2580 synthase|nr:RluA family pseudouridine synthase [Burkholderiales bacterium]